MSADETIARAYAEALLALAEEHAARAEIMAEAQDLALTLSPALIRALTRPGLGPERTQVLVDRLVDGALHPDLANLIRLLARRGRVSLLPQVLIAIDEVDRQQRGEVPVRIVSAAPLDPALRQVVGDHLRATVPARGGLLLHFVVDPALIAGLRIHIGDRQLIDLSAARRLRRLRSAMRAAPLSSVMTGGASG